MTGHREQRIHGQAGRDCEASGPSGEHPQGGHHAEGGKVRGV